MRQREVLIESALGKCATRFEYAVAGQNRIGWFKCLSPDDDGAAGPALNHVEQWWHTLHAANIRLFIGPQLIHPAASDTTKSPPQGVRPSSQQAAAPEVADAGDEGTRLQLFALPDLPTLEIVEFCRTGSHHAPPESFHEGVWAQLKQQLITLDPALLDRFGGDTGVRKWVTGRRHGHEPWRSVRSALMTIMDLCPFAIQLAHGANLHATFLKPVDRDLASEIAGLIVRLNPEALEIPPAELQRLGLAVPLDPAEPEIPDYEAALVEYISRAGRFQLWWG